MGGEVSGSGGSACCMPKVWKVRREKLDFLADNPFCMKRFA